MPDVDRIPRTEWERQVRPYGCRKIADVAPGVELWETGWHEPFTMSPEGDLYDGWQCRRIMTYVIHKTMPPGWRTQE
jgi:hypothetical protein